MSNHAERGAVLPLTLIIMLVLVGLVSALLAIGVSEPLIAGNLLAGTQAFHVAEAGIERALGKMYTELGSPCGGGAGICTSTAVAAYTGTLFSNVSLGAGAYTVTVISNANDTVTLRSVGTGPNGATRTVEAIVTARYDFRDAIITNDDLTMTGNGCVEGTLGGVHSNQELTVTGSVRIEQAATSTGAYHGPDPNHPTGGATVGSGSGGDKPRVTIPDLQPSAFRSNATIVLTTRTSVDERGRATTVGAATDGNGNTISIPEGWSYSSGQWSCCSGDNGTNGFYYIEGDVHISSSPNSAANPWRATLVTTGSLDISGHPAIAPATDSSTGKPWDIQFLAGTDISMGGSPNDCTNCLAGLIYAREQFNINGNVPIRGAIMALDSGDTSTLVRAGRNQFSGSACVILNSDLRVRGAMGPLRIVSWRVITG